MMRGFAKLGKSNLVRVFVATMAAVLFVNVASADSSPSNQIRGVKISRDGAKTLVTVLGSDRPSYTAFKLKSPKRLVIDIANSQVRGVPSIIESGEGVVDAVAVSEYSVKGVPVARVMINFKEDTAYRVRVKGNKLIASLSGKPKKNGSATALKKSTSDLELQKARHQADAEVKKARAEAESAKKQIEKEVLKAQKEIAEAKKQKEHANKELARYKKESLARKREADLAKKREEEALALLAKEKKVHASKEKNRKSNYLEEEKRASNELAKYRTQVTKAEALARDEKRRREELKNQLDIIKGQLEDTTKSKNTAEQALAGAQSRAVNLKREAFSQTQAKAKAEKETKKALAAQRKAEANYNKANSLTKEKLRVILQQKERATEEAKKKLSNIEFEKMATSLELAKARNKLKIAIDEAEQAKQKQDLIKRRKKSELAKAEVKRLEAEQAAKAAVRKASKARAAADAAEKKVASIQRIAEQQKATVNNKAEKRIEAAKLKLKRAEEAREKYESEWNKAENRALEAEKLASKFERDLDGAKGQAVYAEKKLGELEEELKDIRKKARMAENRAKQVENQLLKTSEQAAMDAKRADQIEKELLDAKGVIADQRQQMGKLAADNAKERKLSQEEKRLRRLAEMRSKKMASKQTAKAQVDTKASSRIEDIKFSSEGNKQKVVLELSGPLPYNTTVNDNGSATMAFKGASLAPTLERTLDVTDFGGVIGSVSSYKKDGDVQIEVDVERLATSSVKRKGNTIEWLFSSRKSSATSKQKEEPLVPQGSQSRTVAREDKSAYAYPYERTAGYSANTEKKGRKGKRYTGRHIDLDFKDADIHNILRLLADVGHVNIITGDDVTGTVTIRMRDVAWDHALDVILNAKRLGMVREGNLIRVAPQETLEKEREMEIARRKQKIALEPIETRLIPVSYATADELKPRAADLLTERGTLSVDERTNVIIARDTKGALNQIEALIRNLDTQTPQVLIESRIVEATSTYAREIGIQWGGDFSASTATGNPTGLAFPSSVGVTGGAMDNKTPIAGMSSLRSGQPNPNFGVNLPAAVGTGSGGALGITLGSIANNANLALRLSAMEESGTLRILSSPKILTLDNREAHIEQGTLIPYSQISALGIQTAFKEAKLNLTVTPHVTADGSVLLQLKVMRDEPDFNNTGARGDPTILKREAETELLVSDGHTAVIGGIFTRNHGTSYKKVPFFADIPILGWLFKNRKDTDRRSEMLIFITPRIVNRAESIGH